MKKIEEEDIELLLDMSRMREDKYEERGCMTEIEDFEKKLGQGKRKGVRANVTSVS